MDGISRKLEEAWVEALRNDSIELQPDDDFFQLGGGSLAAVQLAAAARTKGLTLCVEDIYRKRTLSAMLRMLKPPSLSSSRELKPFTLLNLTNETSKEALFGEIEVQWAIAKHAIEDIYPCTPTQEGLMIQSSDCPGIYISSTIFTLPAHVNLDSFKHSWQILVNRVDILRTTIVYSKDMGNLQCILKPQQLTWDVPLSLQSYVDSRRKLLKGYGKPLARQAIITERNVNYFVWTAHHAVYDGWTMSIIHDLVQTVCNGKDFPHIPPFRGFVVYLTKIDLLASRRFWELELEGAPRPSFPLTISRVTSTSSNNAVEMKVSRAIHLPHDPRLDFSIANIVQAAWAIVNAQYCMSNDIVFGTIRMGRNVSVPNVWEILGPTMTTVPVRMRLDLMQTVLDLLLSTRKNNSAMTPFQHIGLQNLRNINHHTEAACDFKNLLVIQPTYQQLPSKHAFEVPLRRENTEFSTYPLFMECKSGIEDLLLVAHFNAEMIQEAEIIRVLCLFEHVILQMLCASEETKLSELDLLSPADKSQLMQWNETPPVEIAQCVHELFQQQAIRRPTAEAASSWDGNLTYAQLDQSSSALAQHLVQTLNVGPEVMVPLCFDKSIWTVVAMMGVVKAGASCVAISPLHPVERIRSIVTACSANVVLITPRYRSLFVSLEIDVLPIEASWIDRLPNSNGFSHPLVLPSSPVFVGFTSGSTGTPKGIVVEHASMVSSAKAHASAWRIGHKSRVLQFSAYTFDASIADTFTTLMYGGCICIPSEEERMNDIAGAITRLNANWALLTPTVADMVDPNSVPSLKFLLVGGEAPSKATLRRWSNVLDLEMSYGPTECTIYSTSTGRLNVSSDPSNLGFSIGCRLWIVDPLTANRLAPIGAIGELFIEGRVVARGYLGDAEKTRHSFTENPSWLPVDRSSGNRRVYRTGDLVRYNNDGSINFIGRRDTQVKLHGQRIETSEIENVLLIHSAVCSGMVLLPRMGPCKDRLVAVMSFRDKEIVESLGDPALHCLQFLSGTSKVRANEHVSGIKRKLYEKLPSYMIPSIWLTVERMPQNQSAKVDRAMITNWVNEMSVKAYQSALDDLKEGETVAMTQVEEQLQQIWSTVLNIDVHEVPINRSFLSLGGDSISAMQVASRCRNAKLAVKVHDIIRAQDLRQLATRVQSSSHATSTRTVETEEPSPLSPIQEMYFNLPGSSQGHFNQSFFLRATSDISEQLVSRAVETIVRRHAMLRARFSKDANGRWSQRITDDVPNSYSFVSRQIDEIDEAKDIIATHHHQLNPETGPMIAVGIFYPKPVNDLGVSPPYVSLVAHHLVIDLVSWRIILEDLESILQGDGHLSIDSFPFLSWCRLQQEEYAGKVPSLGAHESLHELSPNMDCWGMSGKENIQGDIMEEGFCLEPAMTSSLLAECNNAFNTEPLDIFTAVIATAFARVFKDRQAPQIFIEGHGREPWTEDVDLSRTVGWFTIMAPISVEVGADIDLFQALRSIKDARRRTPGNGLPYFASRLLRSEDVPTAGEYPQAEILLNYHGRYQQFERPNALFRKLAAPCSDIGPKVHRFSLFQVTIAVVNGSLQLNCAFNRHMNHRQEILEWLRQCKSVFHRSVQSLPQLQPKPTLSDFPLLSSNYQELSELVEQRLPRMGVTSLHEVEDIYPCSPMQQGMLLSMLKSGGLYEFHSIFEVAPPSNAAHIDVIVLEKAWKALVHRHPVLRTMIMDSTAKERLCDQIVLKDFPPNVLRIKCDDGQAVNKLSALPSLEFAEGRPLHRFVVCETDSGKTFCRLDLNHVIIDGMSMDVLYRELGLAYINTLSQSPSPPYSDYIHYLQQEPLANAIDYWSSYLEDARTCQFPDFPASEIDNETQHLRSIDLELENMPKLMKVCEENHVTIATFMQVAWGLVLSRYTGLDDVTFGFLASGRDAAVKDLDKAVGAFVNMLICRIKVRDDTKITHLLEKVQDDLGHSLIHQHCPLADIQHCLDTPTSNLFNSVMSIQRPSGRTSSAQEPISIKVLKTHDPTEYDLTISVRILEDKVKVSLRFWSSFMPVSQAQSVAATLAKTLDSLVENVQGTASDVTSFSELDFGRISKWNSQTSPKIEDCVHRVFQRRASEAPDSSAIESTERDLTYAELDALTNRVALYLISLGATSGTSIPLCFEKSLWFVVAAISVLKTGGNFVPLDISHPESRLRDIVTQVQADIILSSPSAQMAWMARLSHTVILSDDTVSSMLYQNAFNAPLSSPSDAAYIIFTSGSTGKPKGVVMEHSAFLSGLNARADAIHRNSRSRVCQFASYSSDTSIEDVFTTLMVGGCICIPSETERKDFLVEFINQKKISTINLTPSVANLFSPDDVPSLETLVLGGECMTTANVQTWAERKTLINTYGPSECFIVSTVTPRITSDSDPANIGHGVGVKTWVVDRQNHNQLLPIGAVGELLLDGHSLPREYLGDLEETSANFVSDVKWDDGCSSPIKRRFYKTGDLVRYEPSGTIKFMGREDNQVKLRGQRIELMEIEHHLLSTSIQIKASAVELMQVHGDESCQLLVAFLCLESYQPGSPEDVVAKFSSDLAKKMHDLEDSLREALPSYMIPSMFVPLAYMPMTAAGKQDRSRLRQLYDQASETQLAAWAMSLSKKHASETTMEEALRDLWADVLELPLESIGRDDSFFRLGADSITTMRLVTAASRIHIQLSVATIFNNPNLSGMAAAATRGASPSS